MRSRCIPSPRRRPAPVIPEGELLAGRIADVVLKASQIVERTTQPSNDDPSSLFDQRQRLSRLRDAIQAGRRGLQRLVDDGGAPDADGVAK